MHKGQYIRPEFGHHQSTRYRMFRLPQNSHGLRASATGGNQFGWPSPNCPPCAESSWSAPAKATAHAANVTNKCWTARRCVNVVAQKANLRVRGICKGFRNEQKLHNMIRFEARKVAVNLRAFFFCSSFRIASPVLSAVQRLGNNTVMWLYRRYLKCGLK